MWFGIIIVELVGLLFIILGKKISNGRIDLIHDYHYKNVKEEDKPSYTRDFAKAMYIMAIGMLLSGIGFYIDSASIIIITLFASAIIGFYFINKAQKKYNGGWF